jgi:hypothetical protein
MLFILLFAPALMIEVSEANTFVFELSIKLLSASSY